MTEALAFLLGIIIKAVVTATLGGFFAKLADAASQDLKDWPRINHYLGNHETRRSYNCEQCRLGVPDEVDSLH